MGPVSADQENLMTAAIIPCYKVRETILQVITDIGPEVDLIVLVDDACPDGTAAYVESHCRDPRVQIIRHDRNRGVGGAVITGYRAAIMAEADILVKVDGDGQMDTSLIPLLIRPIKNGVADYTKGNRFFFLETLACMPKKRLIGNAILSFMNKFSSGYWKIFDPTNGYTAIHASIAARLPLEKISERYFFESDMLFRLNTLRAVVIDIPMHARYGDEVSNLVIRDIIGEFFGKHIRNTFKRFFYNYYLRGMSVASVELPLGALLFVFGCIFGLYHWVISISSGAPATAGTVMIAGLSILTGLQLLLSFIGTDMASEPIHAAHRTSLGVTHKKDSI